jgi:hypothetical protein
MDDQFERTFDLIPLITESINWRKKMSNIGRTCSVMYSISSISGCMTVPVDAHSEAAIFTTISMEYSRFGSISGRISAQTVNVVMDLSP